MHTDPERKKIATNVITGFLGVGKTTAIRHLLKTKPAEEQWAVLVNEFGEVGIDGALLGTDGNVVTQVAGGCICCKVRTLSRVEIMHLIEHHKPDRIIIEPTGLALPKQIITMLSTVEFLERLELQALVCLVDPFFFSEEQFLTNEMFVNQIEMADVVLATKADIAAVSHLEAFVAHMKRMTPPKQTIATITNGQMDWRLLVQPHLRARALTAVGHHPSPQQITQARPLPEPDVDGVIRVENSAEYGFSCGWVFPADWLFSEEKLVALYKRLEVPRIKGVFATNEGWLTINKMRETVSCERLASATDSRIEMIALEHTGWDEVDEQVRACRS